MNTCTPIDGRRRGNPEKKRFAISREFNRPRACVRQRTYCLNPDKLDKTYPLFCDDSVRLRHACTKIHP